MKKDQRQTGDPVATGRRAYDAPLLREFGPVGVLTQSGTGQQMENMMFMGPMRTPMN